ncbi:rRNA pseudouridine synthase [Phragmitibacter flavus]|uniref:Pseudouridine synthase n=1 Tax=Phragmitibacter flavus TaxID=2576071 RepID=A0A5R8KJH7_9BACT|nr:pseudouridine synthase [Phragmitibacter flavus]TLD72401.1 rRNA pseudouridine synthase [Phragmitibacter flavus]
MRLNKYLSACGLGSRRGSEELISTGQVTINGDVCLNLGTKVSDTDEVVVHGKKVKPLKGVVIVLHKPRGFVCTRRDERDRETLYNLLPEKFVTLHHVGRLDKESEGLILLTNQGDLSHELLHPSKGVEKEYEVVIEEPFDPANLTKLIKGFHLPEGHAKAERAWMIGEYKLGIVLKQGLKRQIRDMLYFLGHEVRRLIRVRIGNLSIKGLPEGAWKELSEKDVQTLLLDPRSKDRPMLSKPKTASIKRQVEKRALRGEPKRDERAGSRTKLGTGKARPEPNRSSGRLAAEDNAFGERAFGKKKPFREERERDDRDRDRERGATGERKRTGSRANGGDRESKPEGDGEAKPRGARKFSGGRKPADGDRKFSTGDRKSTGGRAPSGERKKTGGRSSSSSTGGPVKGKAFGGKGGASPRSSGR